MHKLHYLKETYGNLTKQGTLEWKKERLKKIGASDLKNIFEKKTRCKMSKKYASSFEIMCEWGKWGECVAKIWLEMNSFPKIEEFGSIPSCKHPLSYSPDGIFLDTKNNSLGLLEIKTSFQKEKFNPKDHWLQVQCGLFMLPVDFALLFFFKLRRCKHQDLFEKGKYDVLFHFPWTQKYHFNIREYKDSEIFYGYYHWNTDKENDESYCLDRPPDLIQVFSYSKKNPTLEPNWKGSRLFFKCFRIEWFKIQPELNWEKNKININFLWDIYSHKIEKD